MAATGGRARCSKRPPPELRTLALLPTPCRLPLYLTQGVFPLQQICRKGDWRSSGLIQALSAGAEEKDCLAA